jgi:hypothetical protein
MTAETKLVEPEHIARFRAFKSMYDRGQAYASDEAIDGVKLLTDYDALLAERDALREALTRAAGNLKVSAEFHGCANCKEGWKLARAALAAQEPKT